jgi:SNF2 family DNA or RNA helicase
VAPQWEDEEKKIISPNERWRWQHLIDKPISDRIAQLHTLGYHYEAATVNYEAVDKMRDMLAAVKPDVLIIDESHYLKNRVAAMTKAMIHVTDDWRRRGDVRVIALTGTPFGNDVGDVWSQLRIVAPEILKGEGYWEFVQRHAHLDVVKVARGRTVVKPRGLRDPAALVAQLEPIWFRVSKETALTLPPKRQRTVRLSLDEKTRKKYDKVKENGLSALGATLNLEGERAVLVRLQQMANGFMPVPVDRAGDDWGMLQIDACPKVTWLVQWATETLKPNPTARALIWATEHVVLDRIASEVIKILGDDRVVVCDGRTPTEDLCVAKESYQSRDPNGVQVLVCNYQKMAAGHDLYATSHQVYFAHTWSHLLRAQSEERGHRPGNTTGVELIDLICKDTVDEAILRALADKRDFSERLLAAETVA